jgi:hypothetical protein
MNTKSSPGNPPSRGDGLLRRGHRAERFIIRAISAPPMHRACPRKLERGRLGLFEQDGFTTNDISAYECTSGGATCTPAGVVTSTVSTVNVVSLELVPVIAVAICERLA